MSRSQKKSRSDQPIRSPIFLKTDHRSPIRSTDHRSPSQLLLGEFYMSKKNSLSEIILRPGYWYVVCDLPALTSL